MLSYANRNGGTVVQPSERIREFVKKNLSVYDDDVVLGDDDNIFELGFVDSPFAIQLVCFIEEEFKIRVGDDDLDIDNFTSVNRITDFVGRKKGL
ncbi:MAG: acyl carrier protein [Planctomycetota bacterium]|jgi:acyl carrier protein